MADFDPDAYLSQKMGAAQTGAVFDPDAYLKAKMPKVQPAPESPSVTEALGRGAAQGGTLGFSDEIEGALPAGLQALYNVGRKIGLPTPVGESDANGQPLGAGDVYREYRDRMRAADAASLKAHPLAYIGGNLAGAVATAKPLGEAADMIPGLEGTRAARILKQGMLLGGIAGAGASTSETPAGVAQDALGISGAKQAAMDVGGGHPGMGALDLIGAGALGGLGMGTAAEIAPTLARGIGSKLEEFGIGQGRRALANLSQGLSTSKQVPGDSVREAIESGALLPGTAEANARRVTDLRQTLGEQEGAVVQRLAELGVRADAEPIVNRLGNIQATIRPNTLNDSVPAAYGRTALKIIDKAATDGTLGVDQLESLKRSAQQSARAAYLSMKSTELGDAKKEIASVLRQANEDAISAAGEAAPADSELRQQAESFKPLKERLARIIPAADLAEKGSMRGGNRSLLGLTGHMILGEGLASGEPNKAAGSLAAALANSLLHHVGPSTSAYGSYWLGKGLRQGASALDTPLIKQLAAALQRANETAQPKKSPDYWVDQDGIPHVVVHTGQ